MLNCKKIISLLLFCICCVAVHSQNNTWLIGTWNGNGNQVNGIKSQLIKMIVIESVDGETFAGSRTTEINDRYHAKIVTAVTGSLNDKEMTLQNGIVLFKKEPVKGQWWDCSSCTPQNRIFIKGDSLILTTRISGCQHNCDGTTVYYRLLCEYDSVMQRYLVGRFGTPADIAAFKSCEQRKKEDTVRTAIAAAEKRVIHNEDSIAQTKSIQAKQHRDSLEAAAAYLRKRHKTVTDSTSIIDSIAKEKKQRIEDSIAKVRKYHKQVQDSITQAQALAKKRWQQSQDSINVAKQKEQQRIRDSLNNAVVLAKKRQKEIDDSLALAKLREQQRLQDSVIAAKKHQQFIADSTKNALTIAKKRQKEIDDSLALVKQQEQQRLQDSIAAAKKRQKFIDDSTNNAIAAAKKRQQQIDDSLSLVKQREQKRIKDSLDNVAALAKQRQKEIDDSLALVKQQEQQRLQDSIAAAKKRQKFIDDSTNNAITAAKKRQQQIDDSLLLIKQLEQQRIQDSVTAVKIRQQQIEDSLAAIRDKEQRRIADSISNAAILAKQRRKFVEDSTNDAIATAKLRQKQVEDSLLVVQQKEQKRIQDSISNIALLEKIHQQHIADSIAKANGTGNPSAAKAFETRTNVLVQTYHITTPDILIELFDNAQIDGDRVSVYHNKELIVNNQMLNKDPITFKIHADSAHREHAFTMIAENLGAIAPNTALMRITVGTQIYKLGIKTDLQTNAKIVFEYDGN
ncbi:MAG: hypothetical protein JST21_09650 [Bacteroidetes bacterium]|nr:hypothetical protein [Bacteroidota bacterium]